MDQKQYISMTKIMQESRDFAKHMVLMLKDAGLLDERFLHLKLDIGEIPYEDKQFCSIELAPSIGAANADWYEDGMKQNYFNGKGWVVDRDPCTKSGVVPLDICPFGMPNLICADGGCPYFKKAAGNEAEHSNGSVWFSSSDDDPPMVCDGDLNEMAESK